MSSSSPTVELRPLRPEEHEAVLAILREPSVSRWWGPAPETLTDQVEDPQAILVGGELAGIVDIWVEDEPGFEHAGLDIVLAERFQDRGIGTTAVRLAARECFEARGHHRLTIDPDAANERAIRCYEAVGFRRVGVMRAYSRVVDGEWRDGLLLDLLPEDLTN